MSADIIFFLIPIIGTIVAGLIAVTAIYLRSRERQMMIEKGLSAEQIREFLNRKAVDRTGRGSRHILLRIGIICFFFGLGLGTGLMITYSTGRAYWIPLFLFTVTGLGFVIADLAGKKRAEDACRNRISEEHNPQD
jgi:hypothetical protein